MSDKSDVTTHEVGDEWEYLCGASLIRGPFRVREVVQTEHGLALRLSGIVAPRLVTELLAYGWRRIT